MTKSFLLVTAIIELLTGLALVILPQVPLALLLGIDQLTPEVSVLARLIGAALLAIGVTCSLTQSDVVGIWRRGVVIGAMVYDLAAAVILLYTAVFLKLPGPALWPAAILHIALTVWAVLCLTSTSME